ncbi:hypothetical protein [Rhodococcus sp. IEGM1428]|uniref:hypothetical protein n=1 Tax=Rhodococcus sp. IEGM1428 TaxID=3392191 RepID=UPI003D0DE220
MTSEADDARSSLQHAIRVKQEAAQGRPHLWIYLVVLAVLVAVAGPMYALDPDLRLHALMGGATYAASPALVEFYWLLFLPLVYLTVGSYVWARARREGVRISHVVPALAGIVAYCLFVVCTVVWPNLVTSLWPAVGSSLSMRGLLPLFAIPLVLAAWAVKVRDWPMGLVSALTFGAALVANLYNVDNPLRASGLNISIEQSVSINVYFFAVVLLVSACVAFAVDRVPSRGREL